MRLPARIAVLAVAVIAAAPAAAEPSRPRPASPDLRTATVVDLTHPFDSDTIYWPTSPTKFELTTLTAGMTDGGWYYSANSFCAPEHGGTHLDAPIHFGRGRKTADQIPVRQLVAPAVVIDVSESAAAN
ncbi:MAG TPA: cyclase family protein, partial [Thermoanaerobaculia bacterium]